MQSLKELLEFSKGLKILFIEDNLDVREQLNKLFENFFSNIDVCFNGFEALEEYKKHKTDNDNFYDLVITDISMPKLDGIELCKEIFKINKEQKVLVISAHTEKEKIAQLNEIGVTHILQKPVEHTSLISTLSSLISSIKESK
ncbi:response regulator transcription factor [Halarcobacter sp.]|uniref:response regulator transcription factor n=1 Tax=Halarcobacter sp. TaxID=2321133 RepID=UPI003A8D53FD